jgi:hypothetical protein
MSLMSSAICHLKDCLQTSYSIQKTVIISVQVLRYSPLQIHLRGKSIWTESGAVQLNSICILALYSATITIETN